MPIPIDVEGPPVTAALRGKITRRMRDSLTRLGLAPLGVRVLFSDQNGPKGGADVRCAMSVRFPRRPAIVAEHTAETAELALEGGLEALRRRLEKFRERARAVNRRPKKYYVAKRLLAAE